MNEPAVPLTKLGAYALWAMTALLIAGGWGAYFVSAEMAIMLGTTACVTGLAGTTLTCRCYTGHVSRLVRLTNSLPPPSRGLRSVEDSATWLT